MRIDRSVLSSLSMFQGIADPDLDKLLEKACSRRVACGQAIFKQGQTAENFFLLLRGRIKATHFAKDGQRTIVRIVHPGEIFGFATALGRSDYPASAFAAVECVFLVLPNHLWPIIIESSPPLAAFILQSLGQRLQDAHTRIREISTQSVERRMANVILRLVDQAGVKAAGEACIGFPLSRHDVAELVGATHFTVSRLLSNWEACNVVRCERLKLCITDLNRLRIIARGGSSRAVDGAIGV